MLLQTVWTATMKAIISHFQEQHDQDGIVLWFCFLQRFTGTTTENLIEAYLQLSESKLQLSNFHGNILNFTNAVRTPIHRLHKANENPSFQHFLYIFHGAMDAPNEEFRNFVINLYADYRKGGPMRSMSMLELLDQLDIEYTRINNLGQWVKKDDSRILALMATISTLQTQLSTLKINITLSMISLLRKLLLLLLPPMENYKKLHHVKSAILKLLNTMVTCGSGVINVLITVGIELALPQSMFLA